MNYLKLYSFGLAFIFYCATGLVQRSAAIQQPSHCDTSLLTHCPVHSSSFEKIIFAASKYDNVPSNAIVSFARFNGKPLTFSSSTTTDGMVS